MNKITLKNTSTANVVISAPDTDFPRRMLAPSREIRITEEQYDDLAYDAGFQSLVGAGFIKVSGLDAEVVAAEMGDTKEQAKVTKEEVRKIYAAKDYTNFTKLIQNASSAAKDVFTEVAVEMKITDNGFIQLIKKYCNGYDVIEAIGFAHKATEE